MLSLEEIAGWSSESGAGQDGEKRCGVHDCLVMLFSMFDYVFSAASKEKVRRGIVKCLLAKLNARELEYESSSVYSHRLIIG